ncbi:MAG: hypothetical protein QG633_129 [Patescibacteria group bacterium]|nr:hypothetical protein [Patescibacteria group bacterium]
MNVVFEEQGPVVRASSGARGITAWMLRNHIADTVSHAQTIILVGVIIILAASLLIGKSALSKNEINTHKGYRGTQEDAMVR